jgi:hypothetical protein
MMKSDRAATGPSVEAGEETSMTLLLALLVMVRLTATTSSALQALSGRGWMPDCTDGGGVRLEYGSKRGDCGSALSDA